MNKIKSAKHYLADENRKFTEEFVPIPPDRWPAGKLEENRLLVLRNKRFLVQIFEALSPAKFRMSVNRTMIDGTGLWLDGITWEELQGIKDSVGFADYDAVELFPIHNDIVNVANLRHLWIMENPCAFGWRKSK